ncbi:hypothetical protein JKP88DRAFT_339255 [Tribonema minus]|uniref:Hsp90 chaperone protein kinase-targeting subunit n=1 Tax=Tribonema minus TaxID=303371 RepID=A0A836C784_9STRA|nr:hypothetical protein JKP88DRAFT_339255 [Tribonema minus]
MAAFNYSKWDHIELSDDESDCHPNIDKESWFRMKHRSRVEREEREEAEKQELEKSNSTDLKRAMKLKELLHAVKSGEAQDETEDPIAISNELKALEEAMEKRHKRLQEIEKNKKWNWENMCHVVEERTIVSAEKAGDGKDNTVHSELPPKLAAAIAGGKAAVKPVPGPASVKQEVTSYSQFVEAYEELLERFSEIASMEKTQEFLLKDGQVLFAEHAQNYLLLSCLEDEMNGKHTRAQLVARQSQMLSNITELAVGLRRPPQDVVIPFFRRLSEKVHGDAFEEAVRDFYARVQARAKEKRREMAAEEAAAARGGGGGGDGDTEVVELSKEERLGPGGLDPLEVFESLPEPMQTAFESKSVEALKAALAALPPKERAYHMKRCEDSGLWVPGPGDGGGGDDDDDDDEDEDEVGERGEGEAGEQRPAGEEGA